MEIPIPDSIDLFHPERYNFVLRVHPAQFSFAVYETGNEDPFFYYVLPTTRSSDVFSNFKQAFFDNAFFAATFKKTYIINCADKFTFVPDLLYDDASQLQLMQFNHEHTDEQLLAQTLQHPEIVVLHQMPKAIYQFINRSFVNPQFMHHLAPLIYYFQEKSRLSEVFRLVVNLYENDLDLLCFSHGTLILGNHFKVSRVQEALYYVLFVWKQLKMDQSKDLLYCCGTYALRSELLQGLEPFIRNIVPMDPVIHTAFSGKDIPFELLSLFVCGL